MKIYIKISIFSLLLFITCKNDKNTKTTKTNNKEYELKYQYKSNTSSQTKVGDVVDIEFEITDTLTIDSILIYFDNNFLQKIDKKFTHSIETRNLKVGRHELKFVVYSPNTTFTILKQFVLLSDIQPTTKKYRIISTFKHDPEAYTQGLLYNKGYLYESTGLENKSSLRKVDINSGEVVQSLNLPANYFGEGLCLFNDNFYILTWRDRVALVVDSKTFQIKFTVNYPTEGWGLTTNGNKLIMSDGSNYLYIIDPTNFETIDKVAVYDNKRAINYLNELEYVDGIVYANVYREDYIVAIDIKTGKVLETIDLKGILPKNMYTQTTDVLNGIAYNYDKKTFYITGKNWPLLFEVVFE